MDASFSKEIKVGVFTVIGVIAFLISIMLLGGDKFFWRSSYKLRVNLSDVQGLARGSVVSLEGVPIGNVSNLRFMPQSKQIEVILDVNEEFRNRITKGSKASVKTQGALGDKYIYVEGGPLSAPPLADNDLLEAAAGGDLIDVLSKKGAEFAQIVEVIKEAHIFMHQLNDDERVARMIQSVTAMSESLRSVTTDIRKPIAHLDSILAKIDRGDGSLGLLINDKALHTKLTQLFGGSTPRNRFLTPMIRESIKESEQ